MNEGYAWGGRDNLFYYEITTGAVVGGIEKSEDGLFMAGLDHRRQWAYIDVDSARRAVEEAQRREIEMWSIYKKKTPEEVSKLLEEPQPVKENKKFWEIWK